MPNRVRATLDELPLNRASKAEWKRRGWKVRRNEYCVQYIRVWNGMYHNRIKIYDIEQCEEIKGEKANQRRREYDRKVEETS